MCRQNSSAKFGGQCTAGNTFVAKCISKSLPHFSNKSFWAITISPKRDTCTTKMRVSVGSKSLLKKPCIITMQIYSNQNAMVHLVWHLVIKTYSICIPKIERTIQNFVDAALCRKSLHQKLAETRHLKAGTWLSELLKLFGWHLRFHSVLIAWTNWTYIILGSQTIAAIHLVLTKSGCL